MHTSHYNGISTLKHTQALSTSVQCEQSALVHHLLETIPHYMFRTLNVAAAYGVKPLTGKKSSKSLGKLFN